MAKKKTYVRLTKKELNHMRRLLAKRTRNIDANMVAMSYREIAELVGCSHSTVRCVDLGITHNDSKMMSKDMGLSEIR